MKEDELNLHSFFTAKGVDPKYTPSDESLKFTEVNAATAKLYLATYYDMYKAKLTTEKIDKFLAESLESCAYNVIMNCKKALR
ncbi:hypothetical protein [Flavobacterium faecale]|uniref:hypothetical protein n=1 Tax=Flavobacterium faecale TaxID=1355330 RepID=UPI003AADAB65